MAGRVDPPGGMPGGGVPGGGDEEYRATVFDESFVRAAQLEEYSAQQRIEDHTSPVRSRPEALTSGPVRGIPKQGLALALVILLAFAAAIYLGNNGPYRPTERLGVEPPHITVVPLAPTGEVPGGEPADLYAASMAAEFGTGAGGIQLPNPRSTANFTREQVLTALILAKDYVVSSALNPDVLTGVTVVPVRQLLGPQQRRQLDASLAAADSGGTPTSSSRAGSPPPAAGWLLRFDTDQVALADPQIRVQGSFSFEEITNSVLAVTTEHVLVYAVRPAGPSAESTDEPAALFTVRREMRMQFTVDDLRDRRAVLYQTHILAGPMDCAIDPAAGLRPLLAGETASEAGPDATDPFDPDGVPLCGTLAEPG